MPENVTQLTIGVQSKPFEKIVFQYKRFLREFFYTLILYIRQIQVWLLIFLVLFFGITVFYSTKIIPEYSSLAFLIFEGSPTLNSINVAFVFGDQMKYLLYGVISVTVSVLFIGYRMSINDKNNIGQAIIWLSVVFIFAVYFKYVSQLFRFLL